MAGLEKKDLPGLDGSEDPPDGSEDTQEDEYTGGETVFEPVPLPHGGSIWALAQVPNETSALYALGGMSRIFRSEDRGETWSPCTSSSSENLSLEAEPYPPGKVYVGTEDELFFSDDDCASWEPTGLGTAATALHALEGGDLIVGTSSGLRRFSGDAWERVASPLDGYEITDLEGSPAGGPIYAASDSNYIALSTDGGATWITSSTGLTTPFIYLVEPDPVDPARAFACTMYGLWRTTDGGDGWDRLLPYGCPAIGVDPFFPDFVLVYHWNRLQESWDGGDSFSGEERRSDNMNLAQVYELLFDADVEDRVYAATGRGLFIRIDMGWEWRESDTGIDAWFIPSMATVPSAGAILLATTGGVLESPDNGASWSVRNPGHSVDAYTGNSSAACIAVDPENPDTVLAGNEYVMLSTDGGRTYRAVYRTESVDGYDVLSVAAAGSSLYAGTQGRFLASPDFGESWTAFPVDAESRDIHEILVIGGSPPVLLLATDAGVYVTSDEGLSFSPFTEGLGPMRVYALAQMPGGLLAAGTQSGVFVSAGVGEAWESGGLEESLIEDLLAAGTRLVAACDEGVFHSDDEGLIWTELPGLEGMWPTALGLDAEGSLLVGTDGNGLLRAALP